MPPRPSAVPISTARTRSCSVPRRPARSGRSAAVMMRASPVASARNEARRWRDASSAWRSPESLGSAASWARRSFSASWMLSTSPCARNAMNAWANALESCAARRGFSSETVRRTMLAFSSASALTWSSRSETWLAQLEPLAHVLGDRLRARQQHVGRRLALRVAGRAVDLQRRVGQPRRAEHHARGAVVAIGRRRGDDERDDDAGADRARRGRSSAGAGHPAGRPGSRGRAPRAAGRTRSCRGAHRLVLQQQRRPSRRGSGRPRTGARWPGYVPRRSACPRTEGWRMRPMPRSAVRGRGRSRPRSPLSRTPPTP